MQLLANAGSLVVGWFIGSFFPSYFSEKGKNLATKEDIGKITTKIEEVKAALGSRLHIHQVRYEHEFKILLELSQKLVAARDAAQGLRPESGYGDINEPDEKKARMKRYFDASREFYIFMEGTQPFFPEGIYDTIKAFNNVAWKEFVQFKNRSPNEGPDYWDNALMNGAEIGDLASHVLLQIRDRARRWEQFDPGP